MTHPDDDTLVDLALGDPQGSEPSSARDHVAACVTCQHDVAQFRRAYGLLSPVDAVPAAVTAGEGGGAVSSGWSPPPPQLWSRISEAIAEQPGAEDGDASVPAPLRAVGASAHDGAGSTPDLPHDGGRHGPASVTDTDDVDAARDRRRRSHRVLPWATGMAAAGLVIGLLTGRVLWTEPMPTTVAQVALDTLGTKQQRGEASLVNMGGGMGLKVSTTTPLSPGDGFLEVWLINSDGKRMVAVGVLRGDGPDVFPISRALISEGYVVVDISQEQFDDQPQHSGDSLLRGTLPA
ncbi:MAG: anti-sigma factor [Terracoccus sp.]